MNKVHYSNQNIKHFEELCESIVSQKEWNTGKACGAIEAINTSLVLDPNAITISRYKVQSPFYIAGELCWYMSGSNKLEDIEHYSSFWKKIAEEDGTCRSAYGYLLKEGHGFNQINKVIEVLTKDPSSRQAILHLHKHSDKATKDEICTLTIQFLIRDNLLNMIVNMRSNDMVLGFSYDSIMFSILQQYIAHRLGIQAGVYWHNAGSSHIYNRDICRFLGTPEYVSGFSSQDVSMNLEKSFWSNIKELIDFEVSVREMHIKGSTDLEIENSKLETASPTINLLGDLLKLNFLYKRGSLTKENMLQCIYKHPASSRGLQKVSLIWAEINLK